MAKLLDIKVEHVWYDIHSSFKIIALKEIIFYTLDEICVHKKLKPFSG